jgi:putative transposase
MAATNEKTRTRTNTFALAPKAEWKKVCLIELLDSAAALVNIVTYHRREVYFDDDQTRSDLWNAIRITEMRNRFQPVLGRACSDTQRIRCIYAETET